MSEANPNDLELEAKRTSASGSSTPVDDHIHNATIVHQNPHHRSTLASIFLVLTCTGAMIVNVANSSIGIALPTIGRELHIDENQLQWIISSYSLSSGCLLLVFGRLADLHGRKKTFMFGMFLMATFSIGCSFARDQITLDILRGLQGTGIAAAIPASLGILAHAFPPSRARSIAFATFAAGAPLGGAIGSLVGGTLTELSKRTWRSAFYVSAGLATLCLIGGYLCIDPDVPSTETDRRVDWLGVFLVTTGLVLVIFVLSEGEIAPHKWATPYIIVLLILGVFLIMLFLLWQHYLEKAQQHPETVSSKLTPPPLMKLSLWSRAKGRFAVMICIAFLNWSTFMSWNFWALLYYQEYVMLSPVTAMIRMLPMSVTGLMCNLFVALVVGRLPLVFLIVIGTLSTSSASLLFALIRPSAPYWAFGFPAAIMSVFGADFVYAGGTLFIAKVSLPHEQSLAGALFQTMTQVGTALGLTITTIVFNRVIERESKEMGVAVDSAGTNAPREAQLHAYQEAQWAAFGFGILGMILALIFLRTAGVAGHERTKDEGENHGSQIESGVVDSSTSKQ